MPQYEFKCPKCKAVQIVLRAFEADALVMCLECRIPMLRQIATGVTHIIK